MTLTGRWVFAALFLAPLAAHPARSDEDPFADFRIPEHRVFTWDGDLASSAGYGDGSSFSGNGKGGSANGFLSTSAFSLQDSDSKLRQWSALLQASGARSSNEQHTLFADGSRRERSAVESWSLSAYERRYPWRIPLGLQISGTAVGVYQQSWFRDHSVETFGPNHVERRMRHQERNYIYHLSAGAAVGGGRVRDATSVYDVLVLEDRLRKRGVLSGPLSAATRNQLAGLIYFRDLHYTVLDRPGKTFWSELVAILKRDSSFRSEIDAVSVFEVLEPYLGGSGLNSTDLLPRPIILRLRGVFVGISAFGAYQRQALRRQDSFFIQTSVNDTLLPPSFADQSGSLDVDQVDILAGPTAEFHRPFGMTRQLDASSSLVFPTKDPEHSMRWVSSVRAQWIVADRWLAGASLQHARDYSRTHSDWGITTGASLAWYVENRIRLGLDAQSTHIYGLDNYQRDHRVSLSVGYRFSGRLEAPGLIEPVRLP